ncbi:MAG TPA: hypothetical protein VE999_05525 [Gemmataceae bacterium]|nr:hypothetical protein [Gemmataceae bacterium]
MLRILYAGLLLASLAVLGLAAYDYCTSDDGPGAAIDDPEIEIPDALAGTTIPVAFSIHNPTRHSVRIVGLREC